MPPPGILPVMLDLMFYCLDMIFINSSNLSLILLYVICYTTIDIHNFVKFKLSSYPANI